MKYAPYPTVPLETRRWPRRVIDTPPIWCSVDLRDGNQALPIWCSVDLRDGNQALPKPMDLAKRLRLFALLVQLGFKEIEIAFPAASAQDFGFVRHLIENDLIPEDVAIQVIMPGRRELIDRTFDAVEGARNVILHLYFSTSEQHQRIVFRKRPDELRGMIWRAAEYITDRAERTRGPNLHFEFSPESFTATPLDFALSVCQGCVDIWRPTAERRLILNLPATVELSTANIFADRVEWFCDHLADRDKCVVSVHPHNDRGTGVAATELAIMAGADRVEGTLFGAGERTGNVDLVTLALNLLTQGVDPGLSFADIDRIVEVFEACVEIPVHPRHPYAGDLVFTAYAGSHQDAIRKGLRHRRLRNDERWEVPYVPIDPHDLGRGYERLIGITNQSGKGGAAFVVESHLGIELPDWLARDFSALVQKIAETRNGELDAAAVVDLFERTYLHRRRRGDPPRPRSAAPKPAAAPRNAELKAYVSGLLNAAERGYVVRNAEAARRVGKHAPEVVTFLRIEIDRDECLNRVGIAATVAESVATALGDLAHTESSR